MDDISTKEIYQVAHHAWLGILVVDRVQGIASRQNGKGEIMDSALIKGPVSYPGCPNGLKLFWPRYQTFEILNIHSDRTAWLYRENDFHLRHYPAPSLPVATVCHRKRWFSYRTSKNGCSTIMYTAMNEDQGFTHTGFVGRPWQPKWHKEFKRQSVNYMERDIREYSGYRKFLVWKDPVERFLTYANYLFVRDLPMPQPYLRYGQDNKQNHIEKIVKYYALILDPQNIAPRDPHVMKQCDTNPVMSDLDDVVMIEDLNDYMRQVLQTEPRLSNVYRIKEIERKDFREEDLLVIRDLYQNDYLFFETIKSKIWKNHCD